ncbi:hypothetical protein RDABS01_032081, partial [Bienertia sinuspersici]
MNETKHVEALNQDAILNSENVDRLTDLPPYLRCHILSFLPTRCAVATSILSKRWSYLWISIPALDFTELPSSITNWNSVVVNQAQYVRFRSYVNRVLLLSNAPCLNYVHVEAHSSFVARHVFEWMVAIGKRCVQQLIFFAKHFRIDFPLRFLIFKEKLVVLKLEGFRLLLPSSFHFPCLHSLSLNNILFENDDDPSLEDDCLTRFITSCPVLEELNVGVYNFCEDSHSDSDTDSDEDSNAYVDLPIFENLIHLEVGFTAWPIVLQIIMNAPRLLMFGWPDINPSNKELLLERIEYHGFDMDEEGYSSSKSEDTDSDSDSDSEVKGFEDSYSESEGSMSNDTTST